MPDPSGLYPQPPQPGAGQQNMLNNPLGLVGAMQQIQGFRARQAVGQEFQNSINPDGSFDQPGFAARVKSNPNASLAAPEAYGTLLEQQGKNIENSKNAFGLALSQGGVLRDALAAAAQDPRMTADKLRSVVTGVATTSNIPSPVLSGVLSGLNESKMSPSEYANSLLNIQRGAAPSAEQIPGPPEPSTGAPRTISKARISAGGGVVTTGLPPGTAEARQQAGTVSGQQYAGDLANSANYANNIFPLQKAIPALGALGTTGTGPGTEGRNQITSFMNSLGVNLGIPGFDARTVKDYDESTKYLQDWVNRTGNISTNDKLAAAVSGNASTHISNAAAIDVAKSALALRMMDQGKLKAFQATGLPPEQYSTWVANNWSGKLDDPRAYAFPGMTRDKQETMLKSMSPAELKKFGASLRAAHNNAVTVPGNQYGQ